MVNHIKQYLQGIRDHNTAALQVKVKDELAGLIELRGKHEQQLELELKESSEAEARKQKKREQRQNQIDEHFTDYERWLKETVTTEPDPYIQIIAVITGSEGERLP